MKKPCENCLKNGCECMCDDWRSWFAFQWKKIQDMFK